MFEGAFSGMAGFLALLGGAALVLRLLRSVARVVLNAAEIAAAGGVAEAGARRGDLTAMSEGREAGKAARSARLRNVAASGLFLVWLALPLALGFALEAYALAAPLWLIPIAPLKPEVPRGKPSRQR
ncbi:MAG: hypothetical protein WD737_03375 [Gemmatimonadota bacterium]